MPDDDAFLGKAHIVDVEANERLEPDASLEE